ncbi:MAG: hypothetical protein WBE77_03920, partial [Candidatus Cybelea sp.]
PVSMTRETTMTTSEPSGGGTPAKPREIAANQTALGKYTGCLLYFRRPRAGTCVLENTSPVRHELGVDSRVHDVAERSDRESKPGQPGT